MSCDILKRQSESVEIVECDDSKYCLESDKVSLAWNKRKNKNEIIAEVFLNRIQTYPKGIAPNAKVVENTSPFDEYRIKYTGKMSKRKSIFEQEGSASKKTDTKDIKEYFTSKNGNVDTPNKEKPSKKVEDDLSEEEEEEYDSDFVVPDSEASDSDYSEVDSNYDVNQEAEEGETFFTRCNRVLDTLSAINLKKKKQKKLSDDDSEDEEQSEYEESCSDYSDDESECEWKSEDNRDSEIEESDYSDDEECEDENMLLIRAPNSRARAKIEREDSKKAEEEEKQKKEIRELYTTTNNLRRKKATAEVEMELQKLMSNTIKKNSKAKNIDEDCVHAGTKKENGVVSTKNGVIISMSVEAMVKQLNMLFNPKYEKSKTDAIEKLKTKIEIEWERQSGFRYPKNKSAYAMYGWMNVRKYLYMQFKHLLKGNYKEGFFDTLYISNTYSIVSKTEKGKCDISGSDSVPCYKISLSYDNSKIKNKKKKYSTEFLVRCDNQTFEILRGLLYVYFLEDVITDKCLKTTRGVLDAKTIKDITSSIKSVYKCLIREELTKIVV